MTDNRKTTVPGASVGADAVQSSDKITTNIITNSDKQINLQAAKKSNNFGLNTVSMTELYDTVYPPRKPIVNDLLYSGTYLFVGAPKVGKSFFMGQLAYHVAMGLPMWEYEVHQGTVLYLALEDDYARLQRRLSRMFGVEETSNLYFATQAKSVSEGLDQQLEGFIREHPDVRLIIIDTLQKVREIGGDRYSYASDYEIVTKLKTFSDRYGICLLVVHHTRKMEAEDSFDMISGTNGLLGAADGAFIMQKKRRTDNTALLDIVGRDQPDQELTLEFDRERCVWEFQGAETELWKLPPDPLLEAVAKMLSPEQPEWSGTPTELLERLSGVSIQANILTRKLNVSADSREHQRAVGRAAQCQLLGRQVGALQCVVDVNGGGVGAHRFGAKGVTACQPVAPARGGIQRVSLGRKRLCRLVDSRAAHAQRFGQLLA